MQNVDEKTQKTPGYRELRLESQNATDPRKVLRISEIDKAIEDMRAPTNAENGFFYFPRFTAATDTTPTTFEWFVFGVADFLEMARELKRSIENLTELEAATK